MASIRTLIAIFTLARVVDARPCREPSTPQCVEPHLAPDAAEDDVTLTWQAYKIQFQKTYDSPIEESQRRAVWRDNVLSIVKENDDETHDYSLGWTAFTDMTREEFEKTHLGYTAPRNSSAAWGLPYLGEFNFAGEVSALPSDWDWSLAGNSDKHISVVTRVKDQGRCGSCWAFSTTGVLEGAHAIANGIDAGTISMSEQQLIDCDQQESGCSGGSPGNALGWEQGMNVCQEQSYQYTGRQGQCQSNGCTVILYPGSIWGHYSVARDEDSHCAALVQRPLSVVVDAQGAFQNYAGGILNNCPQGRTDHAILLVGYGYYNSKPYWKVKNSWGTRWGLGGFGLLARGVGGRGSCAILSDTHGVVVYGPYNPSTAILGSNGNRIEDKSKMSFTLPAVV